MKPSVVTPSKPSKAMSKRTILSSARIVVERYRRRCDDNRAHAPFENVSETCVSYNRGARKARKATQRI